MSQPPLLSVNDVSRHFGQLTALDTVSFDLQADEFAVLLGPAGAGKTTALRMIAGLDVPDAGAVSIRGVDVTRMQPKDRDIAMIFDSLALYPNKTGFENMASPLRIAGADRIAVEQKVKAVAKTLQVGHILSRLPKTMSGGERQRIALGRALVRQPAFFLLDEPLSSLDAKLRVELRAEMRRLQQDRGAAFLCATPDFTEAMAIADKVIVLIEGRVRQVASAQTVYDAPADRDVARFIGAPEINLLGADYDPSEGGMVRLAGLRAEANTLYRTAFGAQAAAFEAGVRPEDVHLSTAATAQANGRVIDSEPLGDICAFTVATEGAHLRATLPTHRAAGFGVGAPVHVALDLSASLAFDNADGRALHAH